jgi:hypothetical protein
LTKIRVTDAQVRHRDAQGIVDLGGAGEGRVETRAVQVLDQREAHLAGDVEVELASGEGAAALATDVQRERRRDVGEELLGVVVADHDPHVGLERLQALADLRGHLLHRGDGGLVLGLGLREELRRMRQHAAPQDVRIQRAHSFSPLLRRSATSGEARCTALTMPAWPLRSRILPADSRGMVAPSGIACPQLLPIRRAGS